MKNISTEMIHNFIREHNGKMDNTDMAVILGVRPGYISRQRTKIGVPAPRRERKNPRKTDPIRENIINDAMNGMVSLMLLRRAW